MTDFAKGAFSDPRPFKDAASWSLDIQGGLRASRRAAWIIAGVAAGVAALEAVALASLMPLKTVAPYVITVDRQTGRVDAPQALQGRLTQDQAVTQAFLAQYVMARETFDATDLKDSYRKTSLWSAGDARAQYQRSMSRQAPDSPLNLYSPSTVVATTVKSVSILTPTTAMVRFDTRRREADGAPGPAQAFTAVIAFRYSGAPARMDDRLVNPLGFEVTRYRRDAEAPAAQAAAPEGGAPQPGEGQP